jgi:hypothetical protein
MISNHITYKLFNLTLNKNIQNSLWKTKITNGITMLKTLKYQYFSLSIFIITKYLTHFFYSFTKLVSYRM